MYIQNSFLLLFPLPFPSKKIIISIAAVEDVDESRMRDKSERRRLRESQTPVELEQMQAVRIYLHGKKDNNLNFFFFLNSNFPC